MANIKDLAAALELKTDDQAGFIMLKGPSQKVAEAITKGFISVTFVIPKPGAEAYFRDQGRDFLKDIEQYSGCTIMLKSQNPPESISLPGPADERNTCNEGKAVWVVPIEDGFAVSICNNNIRRQGVDDIGPIANRNLDGKDGVAEDILKAGRDSQRQYKENEQHRGGHALTEQNLGNPVGGRTSPQGIDVEIVSGCIEDQKTDVLVIPVTSDMNPTSTDASKAVLDKAEEKLNFVFGTYIGNRSKHPGEIAKVHVNAHSELECRCVYLVVCAEYPEFPGRSDQLFRKAVRQCLEACQRSKYTSITFPAIGGEKVLQFPRKEASLALLEEIFHFEQENRPTSIKHVQIVACPTDTESLLILEAELQRIKETKISEGLIRHPMKSSNNVTTMKVGSVDFEIVFGNIADETVDAIVNTTDFYKKTTSGVAQAIFSRAGPSVEQELRTGQGRVDAELVANVMVDTVIAALMGNMFTHLSLVRVVILQQNIYDTFKSRLEKQYPMVTQPTRHEASNPKGMEEKFRPSETQFYDTYEISGVLQPAVFDIVGRDKDNVKKANQRLQRLFDANFTDDLICDDQISKLEPTDLQKILELGARYPVRITVETGNVHRIRVQGVTKDVKNSFRLIQFVLKSTLKRELQRKEMERIFSAVEWRYEDKFQYVPFDMETSCRLELESDLKKETVVILKEKLFLVDFSFREATAHQTNEVIKLKRHEKLTSNPLPEQWDDLRGSHWLMVKLHPDSTEYQEVEGNVKKTCIHHTIVKIERLQNVYLWVAYVNKRESMQSINGSQWINEKCLFHGTTANASLSISRHGFNRNFAGQGKNLGYGVYFAVNALYSAHENYSLPDSEGFKYMYQARVLTGKYTIGSKGLRMPPLLPTRTETNTYDSVVDRQNCPTMFAIFHDDQAYPEYLITFR
ncbi:protein mono-ADP-ribosyltransferase PARP14-like isoform X2 [Heterodontus francisci]|uniref:protein mono-ADP-ribosyltransferase PARP14-like isoform X2 n=1 Tax=Heterodontus francisci TaxID=7792 RepID=UPI00355B650B